jgi:hypothetical protein
MKLFTWLGKFVATMERVLATKQADGWTGWNTLSAKTLKIRLLKNVEQEDWVDVANLAFFLWVRKHGNWKIIAERRMKDGMETV